MKKLFLQAQYLIRKDLDLQNATISCQYLTKKVPSDSGFLGLVLLNLALPRKSQEKVWKGGQEVLVKVKVLKEVQQMILKK